MRALYLFFSVSLVVLSANAMDPAYQKALDESVKQFPPGDYNSPVVVKRFIADPESVGILRKANSDGAIERELLQPVEMPEKDTKTLFSEAATYFARGRYDLATKRYKQALLLDSDNINAKANLYDITVIWTMYENGSQQSLINEKYNALKKRVSKDILCNATDPTPSPSPKIKSYTGGWGKSTGTIAATEPRSHLEKFTADELKKTADLDVPVGVEILSLGRVVEGLEDIKDRIVDVRITNPNPYPIFFQGRQYKENKTIKPGVNKLKDGKWIIAGRDLCGRGVRDWDIEPNGSIDIMLALDPSFKEQQMFGIFYRVDKPSIQSECILYEKR